VIHEPFEDEVVIVNLDTGRYYALQKSGAELWVLIAGGATIAEAAQSLDMRYAAPEGDIAQTVQRLVEEFLSENLIVPADVIGQRPPLAAPESGHERRPFERPTLQTFTDMQDLLLLDPIHEVDEAGWPVARKEPPEPSDVIQ
jgi:hypothetical protein